MTKEKIGAHGIALTVDAETEREATIYVPDPSGASTGLPVRWVALPYVVLRDMMFEAQRAAETQPEGKTAYARYQDAILLRSVKSVDGEPFTAELLMGLRADIAKELSDLTASAGVVNQGKSGPSSAPAPPQPPTSPAPSST